MTGQLADKPISTSTPGCHCLSIGVRSIADSQRAASLTGCFSGAVPEIYDRCLGPALFEPYAADLARRLVERAGNAVLETSCGTGVLTRQLRSSLAPGVSLVATDIDQPMIDHART